MGVGISVAVWETHKSIQHLRAYRDLTFERTMNAAVLSDIESLKVLVKADNAGIPRDWRCFLQGMVYFHEGRLDAAIGEFEQSLAIDEDNVAACALLSICCLWHGDLDRFFPYYDRLKSIALARRLPGI